jgi:hypothetical protein
MAIKILSYQSKNVMCGDLGRAVAQAVSCRFSTLAARVPRSGHVEFVVGESSLGQIFSEYFCIPCQSFHRLLHIHHH